MNICMIGSGNVATHLAYALTKARHTIKMVYSKQLAHAQELASKVNAQATDALQELPKADLYIFSVKDNCLESLIHELSQVPHAQNGTWIHTAGSISINVFEDSCLHYGVIYPMQTFSKQRDVHFNDVPLFIEGNSVETSECIIKLAHQLSNSVTLLDSQQRATLHLSAVWACNFANHCFTLAYKLLEDKGISTECLHPLIQETVDKLNIMHPRHGQTGPAVRWDENVMRQQIDALKDYPSMQQIYRLMSQSIHEEAIKPQQTADL